MAGRKGSKQSRIIPAIAAVIVLLVSAVLEMNGVWDNAEASVAEKPYVSGVADGIFADVHFVDVGQGDCAIIISGEQSMLIDSGEAEYAQTVTQTLSELGVASLDYAVVTHAHSDHMGAMAEILDTVSTENVIISIPSEDSAATKAYSDFLDSIENNNIKLITAEPDYTFTLGNAVCRILSPFNVSSSEENNNSVVMHVTAGDTSFLFTGDAEKSVESDIAERYDDIGATVLKVGHHGSNTSSGKAFLDAVSPEVAVICVGADNSYGHPTGKILERLSSYTDTVYRTDYNGTITFSCTQDSFTVKTEK